MIKLEITKNENDSKIGFKLSDNFYEFNYDSFERLIEISLENDYKNLILDIIHGCRSEDFKNAVALARESENILRQEEEMLEGKSWGIFWMYDEGSCIFLRFLWYILFL